MLLAELSLRWIHPNVVVFLCPHCRGTLLACKNIAMSRRDQWALFDKELGDWHANGIVPMKPEYAWSISGQLSNLTVTPSINASNSGHWHGHITNGEITQ